MDQSDIVTLDPPSEFQILDKTPIEVTISETQIKADSVSKYVAYIVKGSDREGAFEQTRRYNEFVTFRVSLINRWPGCYVPPLPPKQAMGNLEQKFIDKRRHLLERFLQQLSTIYHLWYSDETNIFLRSNTSEIEKAYSQLSKQSYDDIINKYKDVFKELSGVSFEIYIDQKKEINLELVTGINDFEKYLNKIKPMLVNFKDMCKNMVKAREKHSEQYFTFVGYMLPEYEKNCLVSYITQDATEKMLFADTTNEQLSQLSNKMVFKKQLIFTKKEFLNQNEFDNVLEQIRMEEKEINAFLEALGQKSYYEQLKLSAEQKLKSLQIEMQELIAGKTSIMKVFSKKEEQMPKIQIKIEAVTLFQFN